MTTIRTFEQRATYLIEQLGAEGAKRQALEDIGNSEECEQAYYQQVYDTLILWLS
jgi:hypothetical protein